MRFITQLSSGRHDSDSAAGFTLVEVLAVAPIVILLIATFIGFMIFLTGGALTSNARNESVYEAQSLKTRMLEDIQLSVSYEPVSFSGLTAPQGANNGGTLQFSLDPNPNDNGTPNYTLKAVLILKVPARTKTALDPTRQIVYSNSPNACGAGSEEKNDPYYLNIVYYLKYDSTTSSYSLWRRVIYPPSSLQVRCGTSAISEKQTCAPEYMSVDTTICAAEDIKVVDKMNLPVFYFAKSPDASVDDNPSTPADETFINCIRTCYSGPGTPIPHKIYQTYSTDDTDGVNASSYSLTYTTSDTSQGNTLSTSHRIYVSRAL